MYKNPVLLADYSDPDVIRVGDTFYMTASSFHFVPGLPLLMSHDLINWNLTNYAVKNIPLSQFDKPLHSKGIWAPSLRYYGGKFTIVVGLPDEGIFVTQSADFNGEWSSLRCIREAKGFIDPCPFWDEDGKAYIVHAYAKSRIGFKSRLGIFEVDPDTLECISEDKFIFLGEKSQPTIEGPKVYKRDGYYYILAPAGGVKQGWQTVLRSKNITGPFEEMIVLHQGQCHINGPHQGGLTDAPDGSEWFVHFQDRGVYGRVIAVEPVVWREGWPLMGSSVENNIVPGEAVCEYKRPQNISSQNLPGIFALQASDTFANGKPGLQWQWQANVKENFILEHCGPGLILNGINGDEIDTLWDLPNVLSEKLLFTDFVSSFYFDVSFLLPGERCGIAFLGGEYASLGVKNIDGSLYELYYLESQEDEDDKDERTERVIEHQIIEIKDTSDIRFTITFTSNPPDESKASEGVCDKTESSSGKSVFDAFIDGKVYKFNCKPYEAGGDHWVGGKIAMYCHGNGGSTLVKKVIVNPK